jgi:putative endonuclease
MDRFYVGVTAETVLERLQKHNQSSYGTHFTSQANDWTIMLEISCKNFSQARKIELYIKRMKSKKYIQSLIDRQEEADKLLDKFQSE